MFYYEIAWFYQDFKSKDRVFLKGTVMQII